MYCTYTNLQFLYLVLFIGKEFTLSLKIQFKMKYFNFKKLAYIIFISDNL